MLYLLLLYLLILYEALRLYLLYDTLPKLQLYNPVGNLYIAIIGFNTAKDLINKPALLYELNVLLYRFLSTIRLLIRFMTLLLILRDFVLLSSNKTANKPYRFALHFGCIQRYCLACYNISATIKQPARLKCAFYNRQNNSIVN